MIYDCILYCIGLYWILWDYIEYILYININTTLIKYTACIFCSPWCYKFFAHIRKTIISFSHILE